MCINVYFVYSIIMLSHSNTYMCNFVIDCRLWRILLLGNIRAAVWSGRSHTNVTCLLWKDENGQVRISLKTSSQAGLEWSLVLIVKEPHPIKVIIKGLRMKVTVSFDCMHIKSSGQGPKMGLRSKNKTFDISHFDLFHPDY